MTQEEKAKACDEVREKIAIRFGSNVADEIFSQFEMSEDERIRKALVELVHDTTGDSLWVDYDVHKEDAIAYLEKQGEQKPAWSEDDEKKRKGLIKGLEDRMGFGWACDPFSREEYIDWLKSPRPQNRCTYNPYKAVVESIAEMCKHYDKANHSGLRDFYDNVKVKCNDAKEYDSLYPQNTWKPSDEQMNALDDVISSRDIKYDVLSELWKDLKKLREGVRI